MSLILNDYFILTEYLGFYRWFILTMLDEYDHQIPTLGQEYIGPRYTPVDEDPGYLQADESSASALANDDLVCVDEPSAKDDLGCNNFYVDAVTEFKALVSAAERLPGGKSIIDDAL